MGARGRPPGHSNLHSNPVKNHAALAQWQSNALVMRRSLPVPRIDVRRDVVQTRDMNNTNTATAKQVSYALALLDKAGYSTRYMDRRFADLGATMRQRSGSVEGWLSSMTRAEASRLISTLS